MSIYFIGDLHLGHKNIMNFGQRDYDTIEEHDQGIIDNWNSVVKKKHDVVWVLGDVAMCMESIKLLEGTNGRKRLIMGNHDRFDTSVYLKYFESLHACVKKYKMIMTHIPIHPNELVWRGWDWNLHGHCHKHSYDDYRYINVNADQLKKPLYPISLEEVRETIEIRKEYVYGQDSSLGFSLKDRG